jgi:predicted SnoaL-like aldol condensation-catalyzing enzyme
MIAMEEIAAKNPNKVLEIQRALEDGDLVAIHSRVKQKPGDLGAAVVHIFKFRGNRVVELWVWASPCRRSPPTKTGCFRHHDARLEYNFEPCIKYE